MGGSGHEPGFGAALQALHVGFLRALIQRLDDAVAAGAFERLLEGVEEDVEELRDVLDGGQLSEVLGRQRLLRCGRMGKGDMGVC